MGVVLGIDIRQGIWLRWRKKRSGVSQLRMTGSGRIRSTDRLRVVLAGRIIGTQVNSKMEASESEAIVGQKGGPAHPLAVDARSVCAP
jgi:hypothetical protein